MLLFRLTVIQRTVKEYKATKWYAAEVARLTELAGTDPTGSNLESSLINRILNLTEEEKLKIKINEFLGKI